MQAPNEWLFQRAERSVEFAETARDEWFQSIDSMRGAPFESALHNAALWRRHFARVTTREWIAQNKGVAGATHHAIRLTIQRKTDEALRNGFYDCDQERISLNCEFLKKFAARSVRVHTPGAEMIQHCAKKFEETSVHVMEGDCVDTAQFLQKEFGCTKVAVLNMANATTPGGGYRNGQGAQEENLFRRSSYQWNLEQMRRLLYPIPDDACIYSEKVCFFRASEQAGYAFLSEPFLLDCIACSAMVRPFYDPATLLYIDPSDVARMHAKAEAILWAAYLNGNDAIVLGALGCGAFRNPPVQVATIFRDVIAKFRGCFKVIAFGIFEDHNSRKDHNAEGNLKPFCQVFNVDSIKV